MSKVKHVGPDNDIKDIFYNTKNKIVNKVLNSAVVRYISRKVRRFKKKAIRLLFIRFIQDELRKEILSEMQVDAAWQGDIARESITDGDGEADRFAVGFVVATYMHMNKILKFFGSEERTYGQMTSFKEGILGLEEDYKEGETK